MEAKMKRFLAFCMIAWCVLFHVNAEDCCPCAASLNCSSGWEAFNGHCYAFIATKSSWDQAKFACSHLAGHLVKVGSEYENDWIVKQVKANDMKKPWIGMRQSGGRWQWIDGSNLLYSDWNNSTSEPSGDGDCGQIRDDLVFHWNDEPCQRKYGYICEQD